MITLLTVLLSSLLTTQVPSVSTNTDSWELGVQLNIGVAGDILAIKYFKTPGDNGIHIGHVWTTTGILLATETFTNETISGWQTQILSTPITVTANTKIIATVNNPLGSKFAFTPNGLANSLVSGRISTPTNGGVYLLPNNPQFISTSNNYFRDIVFEPKDPPTVSITQPDVTLNQPVSITAIIDKLVPGNYTFSVVVSDLKNNTITANNSFTIPLEPNTCIPDVPCHVAFDIPNADQELVTDYHLYIDSVIQSNANFNIDHTVTYIFNPLDIGMKLIQISAVNLSGETLSSVLVVNVRLGG